MGYIKRVPATTYRAQRRGGRGVTGMTTREEDMTKTVFTASTHDYLLFFTNFGRIFKLKGYHVPESSRNAKGTNVVNLLQLDSGESVSAMINVPEFVPDRYVFFATKNGVVKRIALDALNTARKGGIRCIGIDEDDEVIGVRLTTGSDKILLAARSGRMIRFDENEVRPMGREAYGVRGIKLNEGDYLVDVACDSDGSQVLTVTDNGYGKITPTEDYTEHHRGSTGVTGHAVTDKTGPVKAIMCVNGDEDVMMIASNGVIIRVAVAEISQFARPSKGVRVMRIDDGVKVLSVAPTPHDDEEETVAPEAADADAGEVGDLSEENIPEVIEPETEIEETEAE